MLLDLAGDAPRDFTNFIVGTGQQEAREAAMRAVEVRDSAYLWGRAGCGKSHLLAAAASFGRERGRVVNDFGEEAPTTDLVIIDDIDQCRNTDLFRLLKQHLTHGRPAILAGGRLSPYRFHESPRLTPDTASRLAQLPAFRLASLSEHDLVTTLVTHARGVGRDLDRKVAEALVERLPRNPGHLVAVLGELDMHAIEQGARLTPAYARAWLERRHPA